MNIKKDNIVNRDYQDKKHYDYIKSKRLATYYFVFAIIPIVLCLFCVIVSHGEDESGAGSVGWLIIFYYLSIGIPITIISFILGISSLLIKINVFAILSIFIDILPFLYLVVSILQY